MKNFFVKLTKMLCVAVLGVLGFSACSDDPGGGAAAYGSPTADYKYMGTVTDEAGNPIEGINVVLSGIVNATGNASLTLKTDKDGNPITEKIAPYWGRNNVFGNFFIYNGGKEKPAFISLARQCDDFYAHHNTVVLNPEFAGQPIIFMESENVVSSRHLYENNAFYSEIDTGAYFMLEWLKESVFQNNLYFNVQKPKEREEG